MLYEVITNKLKVNEKEIFEEMREKFYLLSYNNML